ncbi:MAG TPA: 1-acyl-sn-glycerol-3-phosphate acyltransferase, partial [Chitinophagales bacterium]|nr:1-acyl-sn-glycerol-3-phosphate acyltransferase [Chitinophagales bacterium]
KQKRKPVTLFELSIVSLIIQQIGKLKLIYYLTKVLANIFQRVYYQFDHTGLENVPVDKPVVFAPNHVNAFMDPILIGMTTRQQVRFFARGDVFKGAIAKWALNELNISPVYRIQEGYSEVRKNDKTFEECRQLLSNDKTILMFPEGICIQERRLRPLKKGLARIVFQTAATNDFKKDILVVPIGVNYSSPKNFRSKVVVHFGKPISTIGFKEAFYSDNVKTVNEFTKILEDKMKPQLVIINKTENENLVAAIEEIYMDRWIKAKSANIKDLKEQYQASKEMAEMVNQLEESHPELTTVLRTKTVSYIKKLKKYELRDHLLEDTSINRMTFLSFLKECLIIYVGVPLYGLALLVNYPPYFLAKRYSDNNIKNVEFYASVYSNMAMIMWILYYSFQLLLTGFIFKRWIILFCYAFLVPLLGYFAIRFYPLKQKIMGRWRLLRLVRKEKEVISDLINERRIILEEIQKAKKTAAI